MPRRLGAVTLVAIACAAFAFVACRSDSSKPLQRSSAGSLTATAAPCNEDHAVATMRAATVRVSTETTSGTGIVVDLGIVLTLDHVVSRAGAVTISTPNGPFPATVRSEDPANDLALLVVPQLTAPAVKWAETGGLVAGQRLVAFTFSETATGGSPGSTSGSFTGMVTMDGKEFVRTDTPPDSDSTGGPLFNLCGQVVGMNTLSARTSPVLAIPSSVLRRFSGAGPAPSGSGEGAAPSDSGEGAAPTTPPSSTTRTAPPPSGAQ